jgi:hypothetical protein
MLAFFCGDMDTLNSYRHTGESQYPYCFCLLTGKSNVTANTKTKMQALILGEGRNPAPGNMIHADCMLSIK